MSNEAEWERGERSWASGLRPRAGTTGRQSECLEATNLTRRPDIRLARIYDEPNDDDGIRVLVDRVWPRGVSKVRAGLDEWCAAVAPSGPLRRWYGHAPERFDEFATRYLKELEEPERAEAVGQLRAMASRGRLTLLTATRDVETSQAAVLAGLLRH
jgi:uncharacterized protein YeaO (DUF488 family)